MPQYGIIYIAQNREQKDTVFKVGRSEFSIDEKIEELNGTSKSGKYESVAFFVVNDIISADESCQERLASYKAQDQDFFDVEFSELINIVNETIAPYKSFDYEKDCLLIGDRVQDFKEQKAEESKQEDSAKEEQEAHNQAELTRDALVFLIVLILMGAAAYWKIYYAQ